MNKSVACFLLLVPFATPLLSQTELWKSADVGAVVTAGSDSYNSGTDTFSLSGAGSGISGTADSFRYVYSASSGNMEIIALVASLGSGNSNARAGVMIRQSLDPGAAQASVTVNPAGAVVFSSRTSSGGSATTTSGTTDTAPVWVRLVRSGSSFKGYQSADGNTWTLVSQSTITMSGTLYAGMAVTSANTASLSTATFTNNSFMVNVPQTGSDLKMWLRADMGVTLTSAKVSQWNDQSGNGFHVTQGTSGNRPVVASAALNGMPVVRFSSSSATYLSLAHNSALMPSQASVVSVAKQVTGGNLDVVAEKFNSSNNTGYSLRLDSSDPTSKINSNESAGSLSYGTYGVLELIYNQTQNKIYVNGTVTNNSYSTAITSNTEPFYVGGRATSQNLEGDIAELLVFNNAISDALRLQIDSYLYSKYKTGTAPSSEAPVFSVPGGTYGSNQSVSLTAPDGAFIFYTTNGTTPSYSSTAYTGPISVTSSSATTIKAIAYRWGYADSAVVSATYTIEAATAPVPRTGLQLWLKADSLSGSNGTAVSQWDDQSGHAVNVSQGTSGNRPTFQNSVINSKPVIRFDGSNDFLQANVTGALQSANHTIIAVAKRSSITGFPYIISLPYRDSGWSDPFSSWALLAGGNSTDKIQSRIALNSTTGTSLSAAAALANNTAAILMSSYDGSNNKLFLNGNLDQNSSVAGSLVYGNATIFNIGSRSVYSNNSYLNGDIAEILFYDRALSDDERKNIEAYLYTKYSVGAAILAAPAFSVPTGTYGSEQSVTLTALAGADIYYTTDGSTPTTSSTLYTEAIPVSTFAILKAIAVKSSYLDSPVSSATIIVDPSTATVVRDGLQLWLKADSLTGAPASAVSLWEDQSGNGVNVSQASSGSRPTVQDAVINGFPVVRFDGTNDFLQGTASSGLMPANHTILAVYRNANNGAYTKIISRPYRITGWTSPNVAWSMEASGNSDGKPSSNLALSSSVASTALAPSASSLNTPVLATAFHDASTHKLFLNGVEKTSVSAAGSTNYGDATTFCLGSRGTYSNGNYLNGDIAEILFYNRALSRQEQHQLELYLSNKYGLNIDSDGDTIPDQWEEDNGSDPMVDEGAYTPDADSLPDEWESVYFGNLAGTNTDDFDQDGLTNLQEYTNGSDPTDYYNGEAPRLEIASGNYQKGAAGTFLPDPLVVRVMDGSGMYPLENAPVTFTVTDTSDGRALAFANAGAPATFTTVTLLTDVDGYAVLHPSTPEDLYFRLPSLLGEGRVQVTAGTALPAQFTFSAVDDADEDGMSDAWETAHGLNTSIDDSLEDEDGDRIPNIFEYKHGSLPDDIFSRPEPDFIVDQATGEDSTTDNVYTYIWDAVGKALYGYWDDATAAWVEPLSYPIVRVKAGVYDEQDLILGAPLLLLGDLAAAGPPEIRAPSDDATTLIIQASASVVDGFILSHASGQDGTGLFVAPLNYDNPRTRIRIVNCLIKGNSDIYSGAVRNVGGNLDLVHCTITGNEGGLGGGRAITNEFGSTLNLINSIVWGNGGDATDEIFNSIDSSVYVTSSIVAGGEFGGIDEDPLLGSDGRLQEGSPAIDRVGVLTVDTALFDMQGEVRPIGTSVDLGWDEFNGVDSDTDGLPDDWEIDNFGNLDSGPLDDDDLDGIINYDEWRAGSDPSADDSNGDGIFDHVSWEQGLDPSNPDIDKDGIDNFQEIIDGTDPFKADSDGDGYDDGNDAFALDDSRWLAETGDSGDSTGPVITLLEPTHAVPVGP